jgi:hypothetical protein
MRLTMQALRGGRHLCTVGLTPNLLVGAVGCCPRSALQGAAGAAEKMLGTLGDSPRLSSQLHPGSAHAMRALKTAAFAAMDPTEARAMLDALPADQRRAMYNVLHKMGVL